MHRNVALALVFVLALANSSAAAPLGKMKPGSTPPAAGAGTRGAGSAAGSGAAAGSGSATGGGGAAGAGAGGAHLGANAMPATFALPGIPAWQPPAEYAVDMVMSNGGETVTMHRTFRNGSIRTDLAANGETVAMLEKSDKPGATYTIMPSHKTAMKMSAEDMPAEVQKSAQEHADDAKPAADEKPEIDKLGAETIDGHAATKYKVTAGDHHALMWFDTATGAPLRMESEGSKIEWKNLEVKSQPAELFEVPKGYQVMDMGEQMKQMKEMMGKSGMAMGGAGMGAGAAMAALGGRGGLPGGGGMSLQGAAGGYGQQMGQGFGQQIGSGIGASFGGPIGAMAGSYIGGKVGGWLGHRVATAVTPDIGPGSSK